MLLALLQREEAADARDLRLRLSCGACGHDAETEHQDARLAKMCDQGAPKLGAEVVMETTEAKDSKKDKKKKEKRKEAETKSKSAAASAAKREPAESDDEVEWFTDFSPEAVEARRKQALGGF